MTSGKKRVGFNSFHSDPTFPELVSRSQRRACLEPQTGDFFSSIFFVDQGTSVLSTHFNHMLLSVMDLSLGGGKGPPGMEHLGGQKPTNRHLTNQRGA